VSPQVEKAAGRELQHDRPVKRLALFGHDAAGDHGRCAVVPLYQPNVNSVYSKLTHGFYLHPVWIFDFLDYS